MLEITPIFNGMARGVTRLDGAQGKKQIVFKIFIGSKCIILKKVLVTLLRLFGAPLVIQRSPQ